jgi:hypothetical protein
MDEKDLEPFRRYLQQLTDDPIRVEILAAHNFMEEMMELVISEAFPNSECFEVPKMRFVDKLRIIRRLDPDGEAVWRIVSALNDLRAAAAHRNYEELRDKCFAKLVEVADHQTRVFSDRETFLRSVAAYCFGALTALRKIFQDRRQASL